MDLGLYYLIFPSVFIFVFLTLKMNLQNTRNQNSMTLCNIPQDSNLQQQCRKPEILQRHKQLAVDCGCITTRKMALSSQCTVDQLCPRLGLDTVTMEKVCLPPPEIKMWFCGHPAHIVVTALTEPADILKGAWRAHIWRHNKHRLIKSLKHFITFLRFIFLTFVMLMVGNMFWNMEAISFMWSPSPLKLFSTMSGAFWYSFSNTNCFFIAETTSRVRE